MQNWHTTYLGLNELPRDISTFELQSFFTYRGTEREAINTRRGDAHKSGLSLHIGFIRMSGRLLNSVRILPTPCGTTWRVSWATGQISAEISSRHLQTALPPN